MKLITHKFGSYVLQKLLSKDDLTMDLLMAYCLENFNSLILNEYSSRVMQSLIEKSSDFRKKALEKFEANFDLSLSKTTSVFLLISCIKCAEDSREYRFLILKLRSSPCLIGLKIFQRVLLAYVQHCSIGELGEVC